MDRRFNPGHSYGDDGEVDYGDGGDYHIGEQRVMSDFDEFNGSAQHQWTG